MIKGEASPGLPFNSVVKPLPSGCGEFLCCLSFIKYKEKPLLYVVFKPRIG